MRRLGKDFGILRALFVTHMHADQVGGNAQLTNM
jgi:glyoxylase-like metal-dependent hydrolase (beta-lactamase superfamily II)